MTAQLQVFVLTIFPEMFGIPLRQGVVGKALNDGIAAVEVLNIRDFARDRHATTDDRPYGGGEGMVMKPEPLALAVQQARRQATTAPRVILLSPQGRRFTQEVAAELVHEPSLALVCGRYEGVDERFRQRYVDDELSLGDYVLSGGELAALVIIDVLTRLIPGVLGCSDSATNETFSRNLLKHPQYTRPPRFEGLEVPAVLLSGDHEKIREHRLLASARRTLERRADLLPEAHFSRDEIALLQRHGLWQEIEAAATRHKKP